MLIVNSRYFVRVAYFFCLAARFLWDICSRCADSIGTSRVFFYDTYAK